MDIIDLCLINVIIIIIMSREGFYANVEEFLQGRHGKNVRVFSDEEYAEVVAFLLEYEAGSKNPSEPKHRRWIKTLRLEDYGGSKKTCPKRCKA